MIEICSLASGSNGNCYYIGTENSAILIDAGIYYKHLVSRIEQTTLDIKKIKGIFITHEHADHVRGAKVIQKKLNIPIFFNQVTYYNTYKAYRPEYQKFIEANEFVDFYDFRVFAFNKNHDCKQPISYRVQIGDYSVGVMTDIGVVDNDFINHFKECQSVFLESNYDEKMLLEGSYPYFLKERVKSNKGHLSNIDARDLIINHANPKLKNIILSHISQENNCTEILDEVYKELKEKYTIEYAPRFRAMRVISI